MKDVVSYSIWIGLAAISYFLYTRVDILILGQFGYIVEIGYIELINRVLELIYRPLFIVAIVMSPIITARIVKKLPMRRIVIKAVAWTIPLSIAATLALWAVMPWLLHSLLAQYNTHGFLQAFYLLIILLPLLSWGVILNNGLMIPSGFAKFVMVTTLIGGLLNVALDYLLIGIFGWIGVIYVTLLLNTINVVFQTGYLYWKVKE
jgi:O-antigen/teichoic acid export membrane protein